MCISNVDFFPPFINKDVQITLTSVFFFGLGGSSFRSFYFFLISNIVFFDRVAFVIRYFCNSLFCYSDVFENNILKLSTMYFVFAMIFILSSYVHNRPSLPRGPLSKSIVYVSCITKMSFLSSIGKKAGQPYCRPEKEKEKSVYEHYFNEKASVCKKWVYYRK